MRPQRMALGTLVALLGCQEGVIADNDGAIDLPIEPFAGEAAATLLVLVDRSGSMRDQVEGLDEEGREALGQSILTLGRATSGWRVGLFADGPCAVDGGFGPLSAGPVDRLFAELQEAGEEEEGWAIVSNDQGSEWVPDGPIPSGEQLWLRLADALDTSGPGGCNADLLADPGELHVILVTDAPERSELVDRLSLDQLRDRLPDGVSRFRIHGVLPATGCGEDGGPADTTLQEHVTATGGVLTDVCAEPWTQALSYVVSSVVDGLLTTEE